MKPRMQRVSIPNGCSVRIYNRLISDIPFEWHRHPEFELTLTMNSRGLRFIGDHVGSYDSHDLVLIPSDMPHTWASKAAIDEGKPHQAIVIWFDEKWAQRIAELTPEFGGIGRLLKRASGALSFSPAQAELVLARMPDLLSTHPVRRLTATLSLLTALGDADVTQILGSRATRDPDEEERHQLNRVLDYLNKHYPEGVRIEELCKVGNMSVRTLHRVFVSHLGQNVSDYVRNLRIGHACMLLLGTELQISAIAGRVGFNTMSNFNRAFLDTMKMSPMRFRGFVKQHGEVPHFPISALSYDGPRSFIPERDRLRQPQM